VWDRRTDIKNRTKPDRKEEGKKIENRKEEGKKIENRNEEKEQR